MVQNTISRLTLDSVCQDPTSPGGAKPMKAPFAGKSSSLSNLKEIKTHK